MRNLPKQVLLWYLLAAWFIFSPVRGFAAINEDFNGPIALGIYAEDNGPANEHIHLLERRLQFRFPIIHLYAGFDQSFQAFYLKNKRILQDPDRTILLSWAPGVPSGTLYKEIAQGKTDPFIRQWAKSLKSLERPVYLRFAYEMNMTNMDWNATEQNGGPQAFIAAWRRIHDIFEAQGADNIRWVWCPHADQQSPHYTDARQYYPGDAYVDWIGLDGYAWRSQQSFDQIFGASYQQLEKHQKPMMIAEIGTAATDNQPDQWIQKTFMQLPKKYPRIKALVYFNADFSHRGEKDWRFTHHPKMLEAFRTVTQLPVFSTATSSAL